MRAKWTTAAPLLLITACATPAPAPTPTPQACTETGMASWYTGSAKGRASRADLVAAHKTLPFGTSVKVTSLDTERSVVVRINDRGPFRAGRIIDLSAAAAEQLGIRHDGLGQVRLELDGMTGEACPLQETRLTAG